VEAEFDPFAVLCAHIAPTVIAGLPCERDNLVQYLNDIKGSEDWRSLFPSGDVGWRDLRSVGSLGSQAPYRRMLYLFTKIDEEVAPGMLSMIGIKRLSHLATRFRVAALLYVIEEGHHAMPKL